MSDAPTQSLQSLLQHRQWVRTLARTLVLDETRADDLEQQTWLAALQKPPRGDTPKAWLGTVMRNLAGRMRRSEFRIDRREGVAAKGERLPATADVVAQAELHRQVVQAVLDLDPPYRGTVLLRHYEGLAPREVAVRMGVPVETVRSRTRRGLQQVRDRLQREHGGNESAWRLALLPLARLADGGTGIGTGAGTTATAAAAQGSGAITTGALLMAAKSKIILAAAALLLLAGGAWLFFGESVDADPSPPPVTVGDAPKAPGAPALEARGLAKAPQADETKAPARPAAVAPPMDPGTAWVRVVRDSKGVAGVGVIVASSTGTTIDIEADAWGRALIPTTVTGFPTSLWILDEAGRTLEHRRATLKPGEYLVHLPVPQSIEMRFTDEHGTALSAAEVKARYAAAGLRPQVHLVSGEVLSTTDRSLQLETMFGLSTGTSFRTPLVFDGERAVLALAPSEGSWQLLLERPGAAPDLSNSFRMEPGGKALSVTMTLPASPKTGRVRVTDIDGTAVPGAQVTPYFELGDDAAFFATTGYTTDDQGEVTLPVLDTGTRRGQRPPSWWVTHGDLAGSVASYKLRDVEDGQVVAVTVHATASVRGHAYTPTGEPAAGRTITWGRKGYRRRTKVGPDGAYRLDGIHIGTGSNTELWLIDDLARASLRSARVEVKAGETATLDFGKQVTASEIGSVAGRITEGGMPLPGLLLMVSKQGSREKGRTASTDSEGRFRLDGLVPDDYRLLVILGDFRISDDFQITSLEGITVAGGDTHTFDFDLPGGHVELTLLDDATGKPIAGGVGLAQAADAKHTADRFPGFRTRLGWAQSADKHGVVRLRGLPTDTDLRVQFGAQSGYERGERLNVRAGTADAPTKLEIKLKKK